MNILPPFDPGPRYVAREKLTAFEYVDSLVGPTNTTTDLTLPEDIRPGDVIIHFHTADDFGGPTVTAPDGFETIFQHWGSGNYVMNLSWRVCEGTEGGTTVTPSVVGDARNNVGWMQFRPTGFPRGFEVFDSKTAETSSNPGGQTVSGTGSTSPLIALVCYFCDAGVVGASDADWDVFVTTHDDMYIGASIDNDNQELDYFVDMGDGGNNNIYAALIVEFS